MTRVQPVSRAGKRDWPRARTQWAGLRLGRVRSSLLAVLVGCVGLLILSPAALAASGSISGEVTEFAGNKGPLQGIAVRAYRENGEFAGSATTLASGKYKVEGLAGGKYKVEFSSGAFATKYYPERTSFGAAEPVDVIEGADTGGINAALNERGKITGEVESGGKPISGVSVAVYGPADELAALAGTNVEGKYEVAGLANTAYRLEFVPLGNFVPQFFNEQTSLAQATPVAVFEGVTSTANIVLKVGGEVSGRVTDATNHLPVANVVVTATNADTLASFRSWSVMTNGNGEYSLAGLEAGPYRLAFESAQYIPLTISGIGVTQGIRKTGIDVTLVGRAPVNIERPLLSGTPAVGHILICSTGTWTGVSPLKFTYTWLREGSVIGGASTNGYIVQSADQGHNLACQVTATTAVSHASAASNTLKVPPPPPPLTLERVSQSNSRWREGGKLASYSRRRPPVGTTFRFVLNQNAVVSFAFTQQVGGRKVRGRCVAQTRRNRHSRSCKRTVTQGTLKFSGHSGLNTVAFQGRTSRSKRLPLGAYRLQITASNSAGQRSSIRSLNFTIVR